MVETTAEKGLFRLKGILALMENMSKEIKDKLPKAYSKELVEILFRLPYTKRQHLIDAKLGTLKTVGNYLRDVEQEGFLKSVKIGKEKLYLNYRLMEIMDK